MDYGNMTPARGRVQTDGGGSATIFAAIDGARWNVQAGIIGWALLSGATTWGFYETTASGTGAIMWQLPAIATSGALEVYLGEIGQQASATGSRFAVSTGACAGSAWFAFTGFYTGT